MRPGRRASPTLFYTPAHVRTTISAFANIIPQHSPTAKEKPDKTGKAAWEIPPPSRFCLAVLLVLEGAAFGAALGRNVAAAAAHADVLSLAAFVLVVSAALHLALDIGIHGRILAHGVLTGARTPLLIGSAAGLAALMSGRTIHLDARQAALVVLKMLTALHLTFQTIHTRHLVFGVISRSV